MKGNPLFPILFELLPFLKRAWVQMVDCVSVEKESGRGFFSSAWYPHIRISDNLLLHIPAILRRARHKVNCLKGKRGYSGV